MQIQKYLLIAGGLIVFQGVQAQTECKVLLPALEGQYEGDCQKGKAEGSGKAQGTDQYQGEFKAGLPHGKGTYTWKNGNIYDGDWVRGKREGSGNMVFKRAGKADSIVTGFWKKDTYVGKYEKPYLVHSQTAHVARATVTFETSPSKEITLLLSNTTGNTPTISGTITPRATLTGVNLAKGSYLKLTNLYETNKQVAYKLEQVVFPLRGKFKFGNQEIDIEFLEEGKYSVDLNLNN